MREKIRSYDMNLEEDFMCMESEVRQLESDYAKLEARLGEAVELLRDWNTSLSNVLKKQELDLPIYDLFNMRYCLTERFLTTLDQEKEKS